MLCLLLLSYAEAKRVWDRNDAKMIQSFRENAPAIMDLVQETSFALAAEEIERAGASPEAV